MYADPFAIPTRSERRVRRCAWVVATVAHVGITFFLLNRWAAQFATARPVIEPVATSEILESEIARQLAAEIAPAADDPPRVPAPAITTAIEPGRGIVSSVVSRLVNYRDADVGPDPLATVREKAQLLEQISSPREIERMAASLREAMGASAAPVATPTADTPPVDWNWAVPSTAERIEREGRVEIHETYVDRRGGASTMVHVRERGANAGDYRYSVYLIEQGRPLDANKCSAEEFNAAAERAEPFDIINEFPLLRELHRSAIVPIMDKLVHGEAATTQPADDED